MELSNEDIERARKVNLAAYLTSKGEQLVKNGTRYKHKIHDSLVFTDNKYYWNSKTEPGNALDYAVKYLNMEFKEAVKDLCNFSGVYIETVKPEYERKKHVINFKISNTELTKNCRRTIAYLSKIRGLNPKMIVELIRKGLIAQTKERANIAFMVKDEKGDVVGIEYNTTLSDSRFKGIEKGSNPRYGFNISNCKANEVKNLFYFESSIDLLSFNQIYNKTIPEKSILISMTGLKEIVIKNTIEKFGDGKDNKIYICTDNDSAGKNFCNKLSGKYENIKFFVPKHQKDWNDALRSSVKTSLKKNVSEQKKNKKIQLEK